MVKSERERKPYDEKNPGIELQNWIGPRMKEESAKDNTKVPSRGLNQMRCVAKENDYKYAEICRGDIIENLQSRAGNAGKPLIYNDLSS